LLGGGNFLNFLIFFDEWRQEILDEEPGGITAREEPNLDK
jgi:hypothetical protein